MRTKESKEMRRFYYILLVMLGIANVSSASASSVDTTHMAQLVKEIIAMTATKNYAGKSLQLYNEALAAHNEKYKFEALKSLARVYYHANPDSFYKYCPLYEMSAQKLKNYEDVYRAKAWYVYQLVTDKRIKEASICLNKMLQETKGLNNPRYHEMALQTLAYFYKQIHKEKESYALREDLYAQMEKRNADKSAQLNLLRELLDDSQTGEKKIYYLNKLKFFIDNMIEQHKERYDEQLTLSFLQYCYYRNLGAYYLVNKNDPQRAKQELFKAESSDPSVSARNMLVHELLMKTYVKMGDYKKALDETSLMMAYYKNNKEISSIILTLNNHSNILHKLHRSDEAYEARLLYEHLKDSVNNESYMKDLAKLQTQLKVNKLEVENKQAELEAAHSRAYANYYMWGALTLILVVFILVVLVGHSRKETNRVKKEREKAEEEARLKLAFFANMNHEIRTPLNAIEGYSQLIVEENDPEIRQQHYEIIHNSNDMLQRLLSEALDVSKLEANAMTFFNKPCDIPSLMNELHGIFKLRMPENVELALEDCPPLTLVIDRNRLTQVITNLFNNATKHTIKGRISFGYDQNDDKIRFFVKDTGEGIPKDKIDVIFDQYVQLGSGTSGVGLGLTICKGIVEQMGGTIGVDSIFGEGSTFWFTIPAQ